MDEPQKGPDSESSGPHSEHYLECGDAQVKRVHALLSRLVASGPCAPDPPEFSDLDEEDRERDHALNLEVGQEDEC